MILECLFNSHIVDIFNLNDEATYWMQGSDFAVNAIDIAVRELIAVATPGEGLPWTSNICFFKLIPAQPLTIRSCLW